MSYNMANQIPLGTRRVKVKVVQRPAFDSMTGHPTLGWSPLSLATSLLDTANKVTANLSTVAGKIEAVKAKLNSNFDAVTGLLNTGGQVVQATTRAGIATVATGDASTGLATAAISTKIPTTLIVLGAVLAAFVFTRHPGKRGL